MTWVFSHCPADRIQDDGNNGCDGCPGIPNSMGKPKADHCEAVFIQGNRPRPSPKIILLAEAQGWRCAYCPTIMSIHRNGPTPRPTDATIDHVLPVGSGGPRQWDNEVAACQACNSYRGHYSAILFWMLMVKHAFDRKKVRNVLASLGSRGRRKLKDRWNKQQQQDQWAA